ncbi:MAG: hypothetical protein WA821_15055 [Anaerolineales bacterium]
MPDNEKTDLLKRAARAIDKTLADAKIQELVAPWGFPPDNLAEGRRRLDAAQAAYSAQRAAERALPPATVAHNKAERATRAAYHALGKVARASCDRRTLTELGLGRREPEDSRMLIVVAQRLFDDAARIPDLTRCGYNAEKLAAGRATIPALTTARRTLMDANRAARQADIDQVATFKALKSWLKWYTSMAKMALYAHPKLLKKLGLLTPTGKTAASKKQQPPTPTP